MQNQTNVPYVDLMFARVCGWARPSETPETEAFQNFGMTRC